jgi:hypothetical protein
MTSDEAIAGIRRAIDEIGDPNMEPRPAVRAQSAERLRVLTAQADEIRITQQLVSKGSARVHRERETVAAVQRGIATCDGRAATANERNGERDAWRLGARHLRGEVRGSEVPGAVVALCREWKIDRLPPLPSANEQLARAEADVAPHVERLRRALEKVGEAIGSQIVATASERD